MRKIIKYVIILAGCLFLLSSLVDLYNVYSFSKNGVKTEATIISYRENLYEDSYKKEKTDTIIFYFPTFEFKDLKNKTYLVESNFAKGHRKEYAVGSKVSIVYDKKFPQYAKIDNFSSKWLMPTIFSGIAIMVIIFGFFYKPR